MSEPGERGWGREAAALGVVLASATLYYALYLTKTPFQYDDEGYLYHVAGQVLHGRLPYADIELDSYPPGIFYLFAGSFRVFGDSVLAARLVIIAMLILAAGLSYLVLREVLPRRWAVLGSLVVLLVPGPFYKFYVRGLQLLAVWLALRAWRRDSPRELIFLGAVGGLGLWLRMDVFYTAVLLLALWLGLDRWRSQRSLMATARRAVGFWVALGVTVAPLLVVMTAVGTLGDYLSRITGVLALAADRTTSKLETAAPPLAGLASLTAEQGRAWLYWGSLLAPLCATFVWWTWWRRRKADVPSTQMFGQRTLLFAWMALNLPQYLLARPDVYHIAQQSFAYLVVLVVIIYDAWALPWVTLTRRQQANPGRRWRLVLGLALVGLVAVPGSQLAARQRWTIGVLAEPLRTVELSNGVSYPAHGEDGMSLLLELILAHTTADETVAVYPFNPGLNFLARRTQPTRYVYLLAQRIADPRAQTELIAELEARPPAFVVYGYADSVNGTQAGLMRSFAPRLDEYLWAKYRPLLSLDGTYLLWRPSQPVPGSATLGLSTPTVAQLEVDRELERGDAVAALHVAVRALEESPDGAAAQIRLARVAMALHDRGVTERALRLVPRLARAVGVADPGVRQALAAIEAEAWRTLGSFEAEAKHPQDALAAFEEWAAVAPDDPAAQTRYGLALTELEKWGPAAAAFRRAIALQPGLALAHGNLGTCLMRMGDSEAAVRAYEQAAALDPRNIHSRLNLARFARAHQQPAVAERYLQEVLQIDPRHKEAGKALADLKHQMAAQPAAR